MAALYQKLVLELFLPGFSLKVKKKKKKLDSFLQIFAAHLYKYGGKSFIYKKKLSPTFCFVVYCSISRQVCSRVQGGFYSVGGSLEERVGRHLCRLCSGNDKYFWLGSCFSKAIQKKQYKQ